MEDEERPFRKAAELGTWVSDEVFEFFVPITMGPDMIARSIDISQFRSLDPDIGRDEIVEALANSVGKPIAVSADELVEVTCPDCGGRGMMPREVLPPTEGDLFLRCPSCMRAAKN